jgi:tRNA (cmo5U34)-methyltransferase
MLDANFKKDDSYDARFADILGGEEYEDLLLALEFYHEFEAETGARLKEYIEKYCKDKVEVTVLEAGPGTGITTLELLKADSKVKVVAVDNEEKMLEAVKGRFEKNDEIKNRVEFVMADILTYLETLPDAKFDAFASVYTLHNFNPEFRNKVIVQIARILKSGGIFINGDKYAEDDIELHDKDLRGEIANYEKFVSVAEKAEQEGDFEKAKHFRDLKKEWTDHMWQDDKVKITVNEQEEMLNDLGFSEIKWGKRDDLVSTISAIKV